MAWLGRGFQLDNGLTCKRYLVGTMQSGGEIASGYSVTAARRHIRHVNKLLAELFYRCKEEDRNGSDESFPRHFVSFPL